MHAFLIINNQKTITKQKTLELASRQNAKIIPFELQRIEDARNLKKFTKFNFSEKTAIVIENIDSTTVEAANAFLKNLEEPNENLIYILTASNLNNVLPTIVSRSQIVKILNPKSEILNKSEIQNFLNSKLKQQIEFVGKIKDRDEALKFVNDLINTDYQKQNFNNMENYLQTIKNLKANGNVSLQMTNLVARMNGDGKK